MENSVTHETLTRWYEEYETNTQNARKSSEKTRDYYDGKQWTAEEITALEKRKQPVITFNLVKRTIDALLGLEQQNRTDPKALPRTPQHEDDADACTDAIRYVVDNNDFDQIASDGFKSLLLEGVEGADIQVVEKGATLEVKVYGVSWDRMFWDVHSRKPCFSDAKYKGVVIWMDYDDAKARWKDNKDLEDAINTSEKPVNETHEDKPSYKWNDSERKRIKICLINYNVGKVWHYAYFTKNAIIEGGKPIPYVDEDGKPESFLEFQSAFLDRDGNRYGYADTLISPQDEVNKRRSKALHTVNQRQTFGNKQSGVDARKVKAELAKPDGHIEMGHGEFGKDFGVIPTQDMASGNFQLLQEAKEVFNVVGANTSVTGKEDRVMSGRAEVIRQQAGVRELSPVLDAHRHFKRRIYRQIWNRIRQYWNEERWIRVTDDDKNLKWVGLNQKVTLGEQLQEELPPEELQMINPDDPRLQQVVGVKNQLAELDVDILIEEAPDVATIQEEQFNMVVELAQMRPDVPIEAVIELSSLRNKAAFLEKIKGNQEMQAQAQQKAQEAEEIQKSGAIADIEKTRSEAAKNEAIALEKIANVQAV